MSVKLSRPALAILGAVLVIVSIVNPLLDITSSAHTAIGIVAISFAAVGVTTQAAGSVAKLLPLPVAHALGLTVAILNAVQQNSLDVSSGVHGVIAGALTFLVAIGITPSEA